MYCEDANDSAAEQKDVRRGSVPLGSPREHHQRGPLLFRSFQDLSEACFRLYHCSAAYLSLRGCRVPSKVHFTAKHLTVFDLFRIALSKRRGEKRNIIFFASLLRSGQVLGHFVRDPLAYGVLWHDDGASSGMMLV